MNLGDATAGARRTVAVYLLAGAIGTGVIGVALTPILPSLKQAAYGSFYSSLGPWRATEAAVLLMGAVAGLLSIGAPTTFVALVRGSRDSVPPILISLGALFGVSIFLLVFVAVLGLFEPPVAIVGLVVAVAGLGVGLYHLGTDHRTVATFAGGVPIFTLLLVFLAAVPGGGYTLVAEETGATNGSVADFEAAPELGDDLFVSATRENSDTGTYRLSLREYDRGSNAAQFLGANGVRCPYLDVGGESDTVLAEHDGTTYQVRCVADAA
jgi:Na+-driven multidrug efflux pump